MADASNPLDYRVDIDINNYDYPLPDERIARHPLEDRDQCRLLCYRADGSLSDQRFADLPDLLPQDAILIRNNTRVINARLFFTKDTGARIEVLCLEPCIPVSYEQSLAARGVCSWHCMVGNSKKWHADQEIATDLSVGDHVVKLMATRSADEPNIVTFRWDDLSKSFGEILEISGQLPIPPYLNRDSEQSDLVDYQTLYARILGSVAAPTAGLHFTPRLDEHLRRKGYSIAELTLHVGAGTFLPIKANSVADHEMHSEYCTVPIETIRHLLSHCNASFVPVGTTSVRTLESLYWYAVAMAEGATPGEETWHVDQWYPYQMTAKLGEQLPSRCEALALLLRYAEEQGLSEIIFTTSLLIAPSYRYKMVDWLITNFHQPRSTLLLLVSALIGTDWRRLYDHALADSGYRFLSYGDACLLCRR